MQLKSSDLDKNKRHSAEIQVRSQEIRICFRMKSCNKMESFSIIHKIIRRKKYQSGILCSTK